MKSYPLAEALDMVLEFKFSKFDETVDLAINLDVDPRHAEENIRVTTPLPHGTGKSVTVLVLAQGPKEKEGQEAVIICAITGGTVWEIIHPGDESEKLEL